MSIVESIRLHIKVLASKRRLAFPIDFSIKSQFFCLLLSIILPIFTFRLKHLVFAESGCCT